ncbi:WASP homolog-associated protein with actin, membranes and microtubules-like [Aricia agestis]|uniref:WASP homolog-associated protein with actin, membranes and microtubules-like n=1 Tax=Aricia agestis TaxID=91739 RepID=UPI001C20837D|nr:WASP homolog-associated protein with actin, membranes and microtubules-like [Aricia agestis]
MAGGAPPPAPPPPPPPPPFPPHPLRALGDMQPVLRSNPLYQEEEQEVVITVELSEGEEPPVNPLAPRRAPSTSSGYGSGGGSHGRVSPSLPKSEEQGSDPDSPSATMTRSLKEDIRACLKNYPRQYTDKPPVRWTSDVGQVVEAAVLGAGGISAARARLHAALLALHEARVPNRGPSLPYCGPGVRPGDVTMMPKTTEMSLLATSALFTLDGVHSEALSKRLARSQQTRRRCRAVLAVLAVLLLLLAVGAVELLMSRGQRVYGVVIS